MIINRNKKWGKKIQAAGYNRARMVIILMHTYKISVCGALLSSYAKSNYGVLDIHIFWRLYFGNWQMADQIDKLS